MDKVETQLIRPLSEETAEELFRAYFNNKMTVILLWIQKRKVEPDSLASLAAVFFIDDLYRHMLRSEYQRSHRHVFQWLLRFFRRFPYVKPVQKRKAIDYLKVVYRLFGMELHYETRQGTSHA